MRFATSSVFFCKNVLQRVRDFTKKKKKKKRETCSSSTRKYAFCKHVVCSFATKMFCNAFKETLLLRRRERDLWKGGREREREKRRPTKNGGHLCVLLCLGFIPFFFLSFFGRGKRGGGVDVSHSWLICKHTPFFDSSPFFLLIQGTTTTYSASKL